MSKTSYLAATVCLASLLSAPSAWAVAVVDIYGTYTDSVTNVTAGDNAPKIDNSGGLYQGNAGSHKYFNVDNLPLGGAAGNATTGGGILFTVDPASCLNSQHCDGTSSNHTETADINVVFDFFTSTGTLLGTLSDSALATFNYKAQTDNLCWLDASVGGTAVLSHSAAGVCNAPGSGINPRGYEQISVNLDGSTYNVDLHDWNDWDEHPDISFQLTCNTNCSVGGQGNPSPIPEPFTLSLFGAGLAGVAAIRRRSKKAA